jgi:ribosome-binding factor A
MSQRSIRVNELVKREISAFLHSRYREITTRITITAADISPDLRNGRIYFSVLGDANDSAEAERFLLKKRKEIRRHLGSTVILKYTPQINFIRDDSIARGNRVLDLLGQIEDDLIPDDDYEDEEERS